MGKIRYLCFYTSLSKQHILGCLPSHPPAEDLQNAGTSKLESRGQKEPEFFISFTGRQKWNLEMTEATGNV